jgi:hypothetical protein
MDKLKQKEKKNQKLMLNAKSLKTLKLTDVNANDREDVAGALSSSYPTVTTVETISA